MFEKSYATSKTLELAALLAGITGVQLSSTTRLASCLVKVCMDKVSSRDNSLCLFSSSKVGRGRAHFAFCLYDTKKACDLAPQLNIYVIA